MTPAVKLGWGVALLVFGLLLLVTLWPVGILILIGGGALVWVAVNERKEPKWKIRSLLRKAVQNPASRNQFLQQAISIDPENPEALAACAENAYQTADWSRAAELYKHYLLKAPDDEQAELHLGFSYLNGEDVDAALPHLEKIRAKSAPGERPGLINAVGLAFLKKGDPNQALEILKTLPLRRQNLDELLLQGLFLRSIAHYGLHQTSAALSDLDRLYAINPAFAGLGAVREAMRSGTFSVTSVQFQVRSS
jgi:tetratricopeptide (TPR) repeat protein